MHIPEFLTKLGDDSAEIRTWLSALPFIVEEKKEKWNLHMGEPFTENATCSYVVPCIVDGRKKAVLKIGIPHPEALHEIEGLKLLNGVPTIRLLDFDKETNAMLLEQCIPGTQLKAEPEPDQDEVICALLPEIWKANYGEEEFRPLASMISLWNNEALGKLDRYPDPGLTRAGCQLKEELIQSTEKHVLLATDLHAGNVLQGQRKPWLAIDIKPYVGDPTYDLTQHLLNCTERLAANPKGTIDRVADLAGVSRSRLKEWMFARLASENEGVHQVIAAKLD